MRCVEIAQSARASHPLEVVCPVVLDRPEMVGDSLVGQSRGQRVNVANSEVARVAIRKKDPAMTIALIGGLGAVLVIAGKASCQGYC